MHRIRKFKDSRDAMGIYLEHIRLDKGCSFRVLRWGRQVSEVEILSASGGNAMVAGAGERWHYHPEVELTFVESGGGTRVVGDRVSRFRAPDLVLLGSWLPHYWRGLRPSSGIAVQFNTASPLFQGIPELQLLHPLFLEARAGIRLRGDTAANLRRTLRKITTASPLLRVSLLWRTLAILAAAPSADCERLSTTIFDQTKSSPYPRQMDMAVRWIFENATLGTLSLARLLDHIGMSKATFSRQFPKHTGRTYVEFVNHVRMNHALRLLLESDVSVAEAAFASGFENLSHFNRMFRRQTGETPRTFRARGYPLR